MTAIRTVGPRSSDNQNTESVFQHFYFIIVILIVFFLGILRILVLRRRNQALADFFRIGASSQYVYGSYPPQDSNYGSMYHGIQLARPPAAYRPDRRVRAADVDAHGRRLGLAGEECDGKDALPAYDNLDRPPKYIEAGWRHAGPPPPMESSTAIPSPCGEQSRMAQQNTANRATGINVNQTFSDTRATEDIVHGSEAPPAPLIHNDLSGS